MFIFHPEYFSSCKIFCKDDKKNIFFRMFIFRLEYYYQVVKILTIRNIINFPLNLSLTLKIYHIINTRIQHIHIHNFP
jgi:hypothetical protein